jgi:hypothetical protein
MEGGVDGTGATGYPMGFCMSVVGFMYKDVS